ncbi:CRTAC1 family protein [Rubinisphaera margarita]|uniref:CRTAC1 family protein n=1 Tax=Rubinisphaera margarita TaxID=2909586 RepID=UPI001EE8850A|nr:CRTAC1 family protein [Rubinisphaera margarita]MCG6158252.1 CRTAC1 family protein [Rubinisphaera margarita]
MNRPTPLRQAFGWSAVGLLVLASVAILAVAGAYLFRSQPTVVEQTIRTAATRERSDVELPRIPLNEISRTAGIDFRHVSGATGDKLLPETMGGGGGFFDFDNDGDQDLLLVNSSYWPGEETDSAPVTSALYRNDGTGQFTDISAGSGLEVTTYGMGCAFGDYDGDGLTDVYLTSVGSNFLFRNLGNGNFEDVTASAGVAGDEDDWSTSCGWFDYDQDGDLDLFVCNYVVWSREYDVSQSFKLVGNERAYGRPQSFSGTFPLFFQNQGDGSFREIAEEAGLHVRNPSTGEPVAKSLGVTFFDFDDDHDLDIIVANDTVPNFLFENRFPEPFREIGMSTGVAFDIDGNARGAMGVDIAAIRNSEATAIAIGNFSNEMTAFYVSPEGDLFFTDEAVSNGLGPQTRLSLTFGVAFLDLDLDGRLDLLTANGHLENEINRVLPSQHYEQEPQLFWNAGQQGVTEYLLLTQEELGDEFFHPIVGRGCMYADIDTDGDIDFLLTNLNGQPELFRNEQNVGHHWLRVRLRGSNSAREAIGARVEIKSNGRIQERTVMPTRGYLTQSELPLTFGTGETTTIERLTVQWPSGKITELADVAVDRQLEISEPAE